MFKINKSFFWILTALTIRVLLFLYQNTLPDNTGMDLWGRYSCDTSSYFNPIEHLLEKGSYEPDFRMPGYGWLYYLLRLFFELNLTCNIIVLIQVLFSGISVYYLALTAYYITNSKQVFNMVFFISLFTFYSAVYDSYLLTESFCTSSGIMAVYFIVKALIRKSNVYFFISGLFFCWMFFLKPVYLGFFLLIFLLILIYTLTVEKNKCYFSLKNVFWLLIPFIFFDSVWAFRNYTVHKELRLLTNPFFSPQGEQEYPRALTVFLQSWGGTHSVWLPHGHNLWFEGNTEEEGKINFPNFLTQGSISKDSLMYLRQKIIAARDTTLSQMIKKQNDIDAVNIINRFKNYIKKEQPIKYYIYTPLLYLKMFYTIPGTYFLFLKPFRELNHIQKIILLIIASLHYIILFGATITAYFFLFTIRKGQLLYTIPCLMVLFTFFIFPIILRMPETRFMVPAFPFQVICLSLFINKFLIKS